MARYYPICLDLAKLPCLVVGGGEVGLRKARTLLNHGATVTVVAPRIVTALRCLAQRKRIVVRQRPFRSSDLNRVRFVFVATDNEQLNRRIAYQARRRGLLVNVADTPHLCDFIVPSMVRRGRLVLAISTEGVCPAYSKRLRAVLERQFDGVHADYLKLLGRMRREIRARVADAQEAAALLERLLDEDLLDLVRREGVRAGMARARELLDTWLGAKEQ